MEHHQFESLPTRLLRWSRECRRIAALMSAPSTPMPWSRVRDNMFGNANLLGEDSLYINLGYWERNTSTINEASTDLARLVAEAAQLGSGDIVVDVGCGAGEQDFLWAKESRPDHIIGTNIAPKQLQIANARASERGLAETVTYINGSAFDLAGSDGSAGKVTALGSAHHFPSRAQFFAETYRVLKPGGRLVTADITPCTDAEVPKPAARSPVLRMLSRAMCLAGRLDAGRYREALLGAGFEDVTIYSIRKQVYPRLSQLARARFTKPDRLRIHPVGRIFFGRIGIAVWAPWSGSVIAVANKPRRNINLTGSHNQPARIRGRSLTPVPQLATI